MKITFLGTGGAFTDFRVNYHNNALLHTGSGYVLLDCGPTAVQSMRELGVRPWDLDAVLITHMHGDHVCGLEHLIWERYYSGPNGPGFLTTPVVAAPDVIPLLRSFLVPLVGEFTDAEGRLRMDGYEALVRPRSLAADMDGRASDAGAESLVSGPLSISLHKTPHVNSKETGEGKCCYGVRVQGADGAEFYYTSDSEFREDLGERFPDASAYFHDTTFIPRFRGSVHSHYEDLKRLPADVRRRVVLMHYTEVPEGVDVGGDGFMAAALKHETWEIDRQLGTRSAGTDPLKPTP